MRSLPSFIISTGRAIGTRLKTAKARSEARLGRGAKVAWTGDIVNIRGMREAISIGAQSHIAGQILTFAHAGQIKIGQWVFVGQGTRIWSSAQVEIGDRVLISHGCEIHDTESHPLDPKARAEQTRAILTTGHPREIEGIRAAPIRIGDDVWIGFGAVIRRGVTIGDRAIVGARAVVDRDVPADGLVRGPTSTPAPSEK
jgi:acetyltransferase-like isoleucine patch superfamily enzyme